MLNREQTERLLDDLCGRLGFGLPPEARFPFLEAPPADPDQFTDVVFSAEGQDPEQVERYLYRQTHAMVARAFAEAQRIDHSQDTR